MKKEASKRSAQLSAVIQQELAKIVMREIEFPLGMLATITRVEASADLSRAFIWMSVMPEESTQAAVKMLRTRAKRLQWLLTRALSLPAAPPLIFRKDLNPLEEQPEDEVEEIFKQLKSERYV